MSVFRSAMSWAAVLGPTPSTPGTGRPDWYHLLAFSGRSVTAIGATGSRHHPTVILGFSDSNIGYFTLDADAEPDYSRSGGQWTGTTLMRTAGLNCYLRAAYQLAQDVDEHDTWQLSAEIDDSGEYVPIGLPIRQPGRAVVRPVIAGAPDGRLSFRTFKPRWTQVANGAGAVETPPKLRGPLEIVWDERPDQIKTVGLAVQVTEGDRSINQQVRQLFDWAESETPLPIRLPDLPGAPRGPVYGFVNTVGDVEDFGDGKSAYLTLTLWDTDAPGE